MYRKWASKKAFVRWLRALISLVNIIYIKALSYKFFNFYFFKEMPVVTIVSRVQLIMQNLDFGYDGIDRLIWNLVAPIGFRGVYYSKL